jgi:hypothetical protein
MFLYWMLSLACATTQVSTEEPIEDISTEEVSTVDPTTQYYGESYSHIDRTFNQLTAQTTRPRSFSALIAHRTNAGVGRDVFHNFLGFDGGSLKVALGLRYGILEHLDAGFMRVNGTNERFDTYEFDTRYQFLNQSKHYIDVAARAGLVWYSQPKTGDGVAGFGQLLASGVFFNKLLLAGSVTYHSDSSGAVKRVSSKDYSVAVSAQAEYRFTESFAYAIESSMGVAGYYVTRTPTFTTGPKWVTNRHTFAVVLSNTQYLSTDGIITNSNRTDAKDWVLGFNITREFAL